MCGHSQKQAKNVIVSPQSLSHLQTTSTVNWVPNNPVVHHDYHGVSQNKDCYDAKWCEKRTKNTCSDPKEKKPDWWFQTCFFHFMYGMSSFPLTNLIIFQRGRAQPPTRNGPKPKSAKRTKKCQIVHLHYIHYIHYLHYMCYIHDKKRSKIQLELAAVTQRFSPPSAMGFLEEAPKVGHGAAGSDRSFGYEKWDVYGWWLLENGKKMENSNWDFWMEVPSCYFYSWLWYRLLIEIIRW